MRATPLLAGGLALLLGACSPPTKPGNAPPPLNKQLLLGKWKNTSEAQFVVGYEFEEGGALKMTVQGVKQPVSGRYTWAGERNLDLEYQAPEDVKKAFAAAAKAYKEDIQERIKAGRLPDRAGPGMLGVVPDELPAKETFQVGLSEKPRRLTLIRSGGASQIFEKAE
jgi:hypothetical protein